MNTSLTPVYQRLFGEQWVLWYEDSNSYSIVTTEFKTLLDYYFQSDSQEAFLARLALEDKSSKPSTILNNIATYLTSCNQSTISSTENSILFDDGGSVVIA